MVQSRANKEDADRRGEEEGDGWTEAEEVPPGHQPDSAHTSALRRAASAAAALRQSTPVVRNA